MDHLKLERVEKGVRDDLVALQNVNSGNLSAFCVENPFTTGLIGQWAETLKSDLQFSYYKVYTFRSWWKEFVDLFESSDWTHKSVRRTILCLLFSGIFGGLVGWLISRFIFSWLTGGQYLTVFVSAIGFMVVGLSMLAIIDLRARERGVQDFRARKKLEFEQQVARLGSDPVFFIGAVTDRLRKVHAEYLDHYQSCKAVFENAKEKREGYLANLQNSLRDLQGYSDEELPSRVEFISSIRAKLAEHEASSAEAEAMEAQVKERLKQIYVQLDLFRRRIDAFAVLKTRFETQEVLLARIRGYVGISEEDWGKSEQQQHQAQLQLVFTSLDLLGQDVTATQSALEAVTLMIPERSAYPSELTR